MISTKILNRQIGSALKKYFATDAKGEVTALYDFHLQNGGKVVNFGGFLLPVQYSNLGIAASHLHTRKSASLFDVSHMLQTEIRGKYCIKYLESIVTADLDGLDKNSGTLTIFTNEQGGILDDLIVSKIEQDYLYVVSNAGRKQHDQQHMLKALDRFKKDKKDANVSIRFFEPKELSLLALQGPKSSEVLQQLTNVDLSKLYFMNTTVASIEGGIECRITRCGYTGEDGFEISVASEKSVDLAKILLKNKAVELAGLGARDSLRLEAGLCLYGNDISPDKTPVEAGLTWLVSKRRRQCGDFPGAETVLRQIREGPRVKRVGLVSEGGPPARHGALIVDEGNGEVGTVTSGCPAPSLGKNVAMGYVPTKLSKAGTKLAFRIRDKTYPAVVAKMPFVQSHYYSKPK